MTDVPEPGPAPQSHVLAGGTLRPVRDSREKKPRTCSRPTVSLDRQSHVTTPPRRREEAASRLALEHVTQTRCPRSRVCRVSSGSRPFISSLPSVR